MTSRYARLWFIAGLLLALSVCCQAYAGSVWVEEEWHHLSETMDVGGVPFVVDADILALPTDAAARAYSVVSLSADAMRQKAQALDWAKLGCDMRSVTWYDDVGTRGFYSNDDDIGCSGCIGLTGDIDISCCPQYSLYVNISDGYEDFDNNYEPLGTLSYQAMADYAQRVAETCGYQLGQPVRAQRYTDINGICEGFQKANSSVSKEDAAGYRFITLYYPPYFQGLRLFSGIMPGAREGMQVLSGWLKLTISEKHGIVLLQGPLLDAAQFSPLGEPQPVLTAQQMLQRVQQQFLGSMKGITQTKISRMAMEYVPVAPFCDTVQQYTLYPAWVLTVTHTYDSGRELTMTRIFDALTGNPIV